MNCNCIKEIETQAQERKYNGKVISKATVISQVLLFGKGKTDIVTNSEVELEFEGQKKKKVVSITHNFCPFCGVKINEDEAEA